MVLTQEPGIQIFMIEVQFSKPKIMMSLTLDDKIHLFGLKN